MAKAEKIARGTRYAEVIDALCCPRCARFVTAPAFCAGAVGFSRFRSGRKTAPCLGMIPREESSADSRALGRMTKSGTNMPCRLPAECAWAATRRERAPKKRAASVDEGTCVRRAGLSRRLHDHRADMAARRTRPNKANVATAAELARLVPRIGREARDRQARRAAVAAVSPSATTDNATATTDNATTDNDSAIVTDDAGAPEAA